MKATKKAAAKCSNQQRFDEGTITRQRLNSPHSPFVRIDELTYYHSPGGVGVRVRGHAAAAPQVLCPATLVGAAPARTPPGSPRRRRPPRRAQPLRVLRAEGGHVSPRSFFSLPWSISR